MRASRDEYARIREHQRASRELNGWITGARALALLIGAADSSLLSEIRSGSTPEQIADRTGLDGPSVVDLCQALEAHGIASRDGDRYQLTPDYVLLDSPAAPVPLQQALHQAKILIRSLQAPGPSEAAYTSLPAEDVLAMAEAAGISALSAAPHVSPVAIGQVMPEVGALWQAGARHLEVGCGLGNALLGIGQTQTTSE